MVPAELPEPPGEVSKLPPEQQAHRLGALYAGAIDAFGQCEKRRATLIDWILEE